MYGTVKLYADSANYQILSIKTLVVALEIGPRITNVPKYFDLLFAFR